MNPLFASPERTDQEELVAELKLASSNPVISGLLSLTGGVMAILDEHRQIVSTSDAFLRMLELDDPSKVLGLRPGEALQCIHAYEGPNGCGTSKFCASCGAAMAIVSSLEKDEPTQRICAISFSKGGKIVDAALLIQSRPLRIDQKRFLILFVQDVTKQQLRAALERAFFHDINNMLGLLAGAAELMAAEDYSPLAETVHRTSMRLSKEVAVHRHLLQDQPFVCQLDWTETTASEILDELHAFYARSSPSWRKPVAFFDLVPHAWIRTDISLLLRVLCNMVTNALEASHGQADAEVKVWGELDSQGRLSFCVWNAQEIHPEKADRIFQLYFSTKEGAGRGIGTYSMKMLGENILGGQVSFTTSMNGTIFRLAIPILDRND